MTAIELFFDLVFVDHALDSANLPDVATGRRTRHVRSVYAQTGGGQVGVALLRPPPVVLKRFYARDVRRSYTS